MRVFFLKVILKEGLKISIYTIMTPNKLSILLKPIKRFGGSNILNFATDCRFLNNPYFFISEKCRFNSVSVREIE